MTQFNSRICGIPCIIDVSSSSKYVPAYTSGAPENCYQSEGGDFEYTVLTTKGKPALWLQSKVTDEIDERLYDEYLVHVENENDYDS